jgi:alcohol dehydrogenase class IV
MDHTYNFEATAFPVKIFSGVGALQHLPGVLSAHGIARALVLCGRSVHEHTDLTGRITELGGDRIYGVFAQLSEGAERQAVEAAARAAVDGGVDALIAVGAGSVTKAARVVAMLMAERRPLDELATRYEVGQPARATFLHAPKCPIINVMTSASTSQHRAGSSIRDRRLDHQLEFFDPKTRPKAVFWDADALLTAPVSLARISGLNQYWWALMNIASVEDANPLVQASRHHAWRLAQRAVPQLVDPRDYRARIDMCAAAMLQVRDEDDDGKPLGGRPMRAHLIKRVPYMLATGLFNGPANINQTAAIIALTGPTIRHFGALCPETVTDIGAVLGVSAGAGADHAEAVATRYEQTVRRLGGDTDLRRNGVPTELIPGIIAYGLRNFNTNNDRLLDDKVDRLERVLRDTL